MWLEHMQLPECRKGYLFRMTSISKVRLGSKLGQIIQRCLVHLPGLWEGAKLVQF